MSLDRKNVGALLVVAGGGFLLLSMMFIFVSSLSDSGALCCFSFLLGPGGLFLLIYGIVLILVSTGKMKNSKITDKIGITEKRIERPEPAKSTIQKQTQNVQSPRKVGDFLCPYCNSYSSLKTKSKVSQGGWIVFVLLLLFFWPLFWIGLLMKDEYKVCSYCNNRIEKHMIRRVERPSPAPIIPADARLRMAINFEKAERLEDAAKLYEQLNMWEEAGKCRRKMRGSTVKHVHVDANDLFNQIRTKGLAVPYGCPSCGGSLDINKGNLGIKLCPYCGTSIDFQTLQKAVNDLLY